MITFLILAAAVAYLFWPAGKEPSDVGKSLVDQLAAITAAKPDAAPATPSHAAHQPPAAREAIDALLEVRDRLAATEALDEDSAKAVDTLWLDLLHGSTK
jgi:hypothetical protein